MDIASRLSMLFGTEEHVRMRRQLSFLREECMSSAGPPGSGRFLCSGSLGEGVNYPWSDDDFMLCDNREFVVKTYREALRSDGLLMFPSDTSPDTACYLT